MADLTFSELATAAPANSVVVSDGAAALPAGVYVNVSALTGDNVDQLSDEGVTETMVKLSKACNKAQVTHNAVANATQINSFPRLSYGTPSEATDGSVTSTVTASIIGRQPLDSNSISANV